MNERIVMRTGEALIAGGPPGTAAGRRDRARGAHRAVRCVRDGPRRHSAGCAFADQAHHGAL